MQYIQDDLDMPHTHKSHD